MGHIFSHPCTVPHQCIPVRCRLHDGFFCIAVCVDVSKTGKAPGCGSQRCCRLPCTRGSRLLRVLPCRATAAVGRVPRGRRSIAWLRFSTTRAVQTCTCHTLVRRQQQAHWDPANNLRHKTPCVCTDASATAAFVAARAIAPYEQLTISYIDQDAPVAQRQEQLHWGYGFDCNCPVCSEELGIPL